MTATELAQTNLKFAEENLERIAKRFGKTGVKDPLRDESVTLLREAALGYAATLLCLNRDPASLRAAVLLARRIRR